MSLRNTKQKDLILSIINNSYCHPNAEYIYNECRKTISNISLGTVYRNLNNLVENGQIKRIKMPDNIDRYDKIKKHAHFICIKCSQIIDLDDKYINDINYIDNNKVLDCEVNFKGICEKCMKEGEL